MIDYTNTLAIYLERGISTMYLSIKHNTMEYKAGQVWKFAKQPNQYTTKFQRLIAQVKWYIKRTIQLLAIGGITLGACYAIFMAGWYSKPEHIEAQTVETYPILHKIAIAESYDSQFCTAEIVKKKGCHSYEVGSVLIHVNKNGTYDIGRYAINSIHLKDALALGYNVYLEEDNYQFAKHLFKTQGSEPWSASKANWNK